MNCAIKTLMVIFVLYTLQAITLMTMNNDGLLDTTQEEEVKVEEFSQVDTELQNVEINDMLQDLSSDALR